MRVPLKEFQIAAVERLARMLRSAWGEKLREETDQAIILSAPTGSGKTVITTATIEQIFFGEDDAPADAAATFLWITDQPELNEQTRRKMSVMSGRLGDRLVNVNGDFDAPQLTAGRVYFVNTQKLVDGRQLVTASDRRGNTFWDTINQTIRGGQVRLYVIIDEAHRGMQEDRGAREEATSLMQRFIKGTEGVDPAPVILGISATPERFHQLLAGSPTPRTTRPLAIPPDQVRESGLLKERVHVYHPTDNQAADMTLLRRAAQDWREFRTRWAQYAEEQYEEGVEPILIVQVQDAAADSLQITRTDLRQALQAIRSEAGDLPDEAFAHAFQDVNVVTVGATTVRHLAPADIDGDPHVKVVFFKSSLNTGWDCPRAEVMMSFRRAVDYTHIAQLVGRMVRAPLHHRINSDDHLNSVALYLPHYDREELQRVVDYLTTADGALAAVDTEIVPPITLRRAPDSDESFAALEALPSYAVPRSRTIPHRRRLVRLARALSIDELDADAETRETDALIDVLLAENQALSQTDEYRSIVEERGVIEVRRVDWEVIGEFGEDETVQIQVGPEDEQALFALAGRQLGEGLHQAYWRRRAEQDESAIARARLEVSALSVRPEVLRKLDDAAKPRIRELLEEYLTAVRALPERRRTTYDDIRGLTADPEESTLAYPPMIEVTERDTRWEGHLYVDPNGKAPFRLNTWERAVLEAERDRDDHVAWLRNLDRKPWSLCVPYEAGTRVRPLFPDMLFLRRRDGDLVVDLLDPHDPDRADSPNKAKGLARYAAKHSDAFDRIELIIVDGGVIKRLDMKDPDSRERVMQVSSSQHLRALFS